MKAKGLICFISILITLGFLACDDDLHKVGGSLKPEEDSIFVRADTVILKARTISLNDSIYAKTQNALIGEYTDKEFGRTISDYLTEFYCSGDSAFANRAYAIDSVYISALGANFMGDSTKLIGFTAYEVDRPLDGNFNTNLDPSKYCNLEKALAQGTFRYKDIEIKQSNGPDISNSRMVADTILGRRFLDEWNRNPDTFYDYKKFREFFPGVYVTTTYGKDFLLPIIETSIEVYYKFMGRNKDNTADSTFTSIMSLISTVEVIQMNHIENKVNNEILQPDPEKTHFMSPAGVCTELTIPIKEILQTIGKNRKINSASFKLKGFTELETSKRPRPRRLLFIPKDSVHNFFVNRMLDDNKTSFIMNRVAGDNTYQFSNTANNIASFLKHYMKQYEDGKLDNIQDLQYLVIPVNVETAFDQQDREYVVDINHLMMPTSAIIRTDEDNMKFDFVYSSHVK